MERCGCLRKEKKCSEDEFNRRQRHFEQYSGPMALQPEAVFMVSCPQIPFRSNSPFRRAPHTATQFEFHGTITLNLKYFGILSQPDLWKTVNCNHRGQSSQLSRIQTRRTTHKKPKINFRLRSNENESECVCPSAACSSRRSRVDDKLRINQNR